MHYKSDIKNIIFDLYIHTHTHTYIFLVVLHRKLGIGCLIVQVSSSHETIQTHGKTPLNEWLAHCGYHYMHNTYKHRRHTPLALSRIWTCGPNNQTTADLHLLLASIHTLAKWVVLWLRWLETGMSPQRPRFHPMLFHVGFVIDWNWYKFCSGCFGFLLSLLFHQYSILIFH